MSSEQPWLPEPDEMSKPFFDGAARGALMLQHCAACGGWQFPVRDRCQECGDARLEWRQASGRGTLYSHGLLRRAYHPRHAERLPLVLATVDLDEGVRVNSNLVDVQPEAVRTGMPVQVDFETFPDGGVVPVFRPAS